MKRYVKNIMASEYINGVVDRGTLYAEDLLEILSRIDQLKGCYITTEQLRNGKTQLIIDEKRYEI